MRSSFDLDLCRGRLVANAAVFALLAIATLPGCNRTLHSDDFLQPEVPLSFEEQQKLILDAVPLGTPREDVTAKLGKAGIEGEFSQGRSLFYAESWRRKDGKRLILEVDLLFDGETRTLFEVKPRSGFITHVEPAGAG
ncbi:MAG: hypothetical protein CMJ48_05715 [Planctomycetaceae bacterium]|nr:hypothetical protein [Planctomycetaceae bacterium]